MVERITLPALTVAYIWEFAGKGLQEGRLHRVHARLGTSMESMGGLFLLRLRTGKGRGE